MEGMLILYDVVSTHGSARKRDTAADRVLRTPSLAQAETTQDHQGDHDAQRRRPPEGVHRMADAQRIDLRPEDPHPATITIERLDVRDARYAIGSDDDTVQLHDVPGSPDLYLLTGRERTRQHRLGPSPPGSASTDGQQEEHSERWPENPRRRHRDLAREGVIHSRRSVPWP
jgi:hypothetical protein